MVVFTGRTVEEAIETGLTELGLSRLKAHIKVISREKKGFLGFGKKPAQVDIEGLVEESFEQETISLVEELPEQKVTAVETPVSEVEEVEPEIRESMLSSDDLVAEIEDFKQEPVAEGDDFDTFVATNFSQPQVVSQASKGIEEASQEVTAYVEKIIYEMDVEATIETEHTNRQISLQIETPDAGRVIGYHGKVLKSLQLLAQNFLHDRYSRHFSVTINVHDYVEHRTETLIDYTQKIAARVGETGNDFVMDSMSNNERKIVHKTISKIAGVRSYSEGNDPNRYVVVTLDK
ncbi:RNA-binding cell elongation regulator Jag/EloR [Streptococcus saliviloxodontae]|uniref:RNA-binding protein KhpB n=1 Tax=Streptococcus saliviloxodontae TaxID=1349416 RepID=A0ABS2PIF9_9STRE|nr:RNA-binding cell elongation regulator Jag/EloR [Streptococcus saliviloxodontae]MBM7635223.1 spoIIIJ-associated protein [Streptococcus saliviloxodontae]